VECGQEIHGVRHSEIAADLTAWLKSKAKRREALTASLADRLRQVRPQDWKALYSELCSIELRNSDLDAMSTLPTSEAVELLGAATLNRNGYVREAALHKLAKISHPRAIVYVLLRLGDWVDEVRTAANTLIRRLLLRGDVEILLQNQVLIEAATRSHRVSLDGVLDVLRERLLSPAARPLVLARFRDGGTAERWFLFRFLEPELACSRDFAELAARDSAPIVRAWVAERLPRAPGSHADLLAELLNDPTPWVARAALQRHSLPLSADDRARVEPLIFASSAGVRESARFALERSGVTDFAARYRAHLSALPADLVSPGAIQGLGETGDVSDLAIVLSFATAPRAAHREAALRAAAQLDGNAVHTQLVEALRDRSRRVRSIASRALARRLDHATVQTLRSMLADLDEPRRASVRSLLATRSQWDVVPDLLEALLDDSERIQRASGAALDGWYARHATKGWMRPSAAARDALSEALAHFDRAAAFPSRFASSLPQILAWSRQVSDGRS
jgi:HEAT repeat protein